MDGRTNGQTKSHVEVRFPFKYVRPKICPSQNMFVQKYIHLKKLFDSKMSAQDLICHKILGRTIFGTDNERTKSHIEGDAPPKNLTKDGAFKTKIKNYYLQKSVY